jgi:biotin transport system substrate-specific component
MTAIAAVDVLRPARGRWLYEVVTVLLGSALIALSAQVAVRLAVSPVPITMQTFAVLLVGALYGSRRGAVTVLAYVGEGLAGLPVFASGGAGPAYLLGPTGGYLLGFIAAAFVVGRLAERGWDRRVATTALAMTIGTAVIFALGLAWLVFFVGPRAVLATGLVPFLPGAVLKIALATAVLPLGWAAWEWVRKTP